jgi:hypothetical protein
MGKVAEIKTKENEASVDDFLNGIKNEQQKKDSFTLVKMMEKASKDKAKMWGSAIIGFGSLRYKSPSSGREVDWFKIGFAPRKANLSLYLMIDHKTHADLLKKLGKYKTGGGCVYVNKLEDIDLKILEQMLKASVKEKAEK